MNGKEDEFSELINESLLSIQKSQRFIKLLKQIIDLGHPNDQDSN